MERDVLKDTENQAWAMLLDRLVHDIREPLRSIGVFTELLKEPAGPDSERALREIPGGVSRIGTILEGLSGYALALRESAECAAPASMQSAFRIVIAELDEQIRSCGATVTARDLPRVNVTLERLMQLLRNLIGNSLRFRSDAPPVIQISAAMQAPGIWTIRVQDNGIGIPAEECETIFEPFARVEGKKHGGAGLGLTICRTIVEAHGGSIRMESTPGQGATCVFTLPEAEDSRS